MKTSQLIRSTLSTSLLIAAVLFLTVGCAATPAPSPSTSKPSSTGAPTPSTDACLRTDGNCLGPLVPGHYESGHFTTFPTRSSGQLTYNATDRYWANALDQRPAYWFEPAKEYSAGTGDDNLPGVFVWGDVAAATQKFPECPSDPDQTIPSDAQGLIAWLTQLRGLKATPVTDLQLGDRKALGLDIVVDEATASACTFGKFVPLIAAVPGAANAFMTGINAGERSQVYFVDVGNGHTAAVIFTAPADEFDAILPHAIGLILSFRFVAPV
jgi:hypothetical protein